MLPPETSSWRSEWLWPVVIFLVVALLSRVVIFGNPVVHIDEQFYLLVGDRMHHGMLPYVDLWDRKPIGLFLIYAAIRLLGGDGIVQYQLVACLAAAATALVIYRMARQFAPAVGAGVAAVGYLLFLLTFNGIGGQSPVFYNLLVALAAIDTMRLVTRPTASGLLLKGAGIMLLIGVAIQIKYTVIFEGFFFGLALLWRHWHDRRNIPSLLGSGGVWVVCALLPTAAAFGYYFSLGHGTAFVQANFLSVLVRPEPLGAALTNLVTSMALLGPFWIAIFLRWKPGRELEATTVFVRSWSAAAIIGYLIFGTYYDHYALPLLPPLAVLASPAFAKSGRVSVFGWLVLAVGFGSGVDKVHSTIQRQGGREQMERLTSIVTSHLHGGCLHVFQGPSILYLTTRACASTKFVFPSHFMRNKERDAIGLETATAVHAMLSRRPNVIVISPMARRDNPIARKIVLDRLRKDYRLVADTRLGRANLLIYSRLNHEH